MNTPSSYIFLSPHPDDVALSCGGLVWQLTQAGADVSIWTICAGDPPADAPLSLFAEALHGRWAVGREALAARRAEDAASCEILGASFRHFEIGDCIYRRHPETGAALYDCEADLFSPVHAAELGAVAELTNDLREGVDAGARLVCPLGLGGHIDHRFTRMAAEQLEMPLWYYLDYPYVLGDAARIVEFTPSNTTTQIHPVSQSALTVWQDSIAAHRSQISTFWPTDKEMRDAIAEYSAAYGGVVIYK